MGDYDVLCGVVIRLPGGNGGGIMNNIDVISERLGKAIQTEFKDFLVLPFGMELVEADGKIRILDRVEFSTELEGKDEDDF